MNSIKKRHLTRVPILILALLAFALPTQAYAATTLIEDFDDETGIQTNNNLAVTGGELQLGSDGVFLTEDFTSYANGTTPTNWEPESVDWYADNGTYLHAGNAYNDARTFYSQPLTNGSFSADVTLLGGEQLGGLMFRAADAQNYYMASFSSLYDFVSISKIEGGSSTTLSTINENYDPSVSYTIMISFVGSSIIVSVDGVEKFNITDTTFSSSGKVGIWRNGTGLYFDNVDISSSINQQGSITSTMTSLGSTISSVSVAQTSTSPANIHLYLSNDNGATYQQYTSGTMNFKRSGSQFIYKAYLWDNGINPTIEELNFTLNLGAIADSSTFYPDILSQLHYSSFATNTTTQSGSLSDYTHYTEVSGYKFVQQAAIIEQNGDTWAILGNSDENTVVAYNLTQKQEVWSTSLNGYVESSPFIEHNIVYIGSYDTKLYAINLLDGSVLWTYDATDTLSGGNIDADDTNIFFSDYGYGGVTTLYAVDKTTHLQDWNFSVNYTTFLSFTLDSTNNRIYVTEADNLHALDSTDGTNIWSINLAGGYITKQPAITGELLVIGADRGVFAVDREFGSLVWDYTTGFNQAEDGVGATPTIYNGKVFVPTKATNKLIALALFDGSELWNISTGSSTFSTIVATTDGNLLISYNDGIRFYSQASGALISTISYPSWVENNVSVARNYMLFTNPNGAGTMHVYKINEPTVSAVETPPSTPIYSYTPTLYTSDEISEDPSETLEQKEISPNVEPDPEDEKSKIEQEEIVSEKEDNNTATVVISIAAGVGLISFFFLLWKRKEESEDSAVT